MQQFDNYSNCLTVLLAKSGQFDPEQIINKYSLNKMETKSAKQAVSDVLKMELGERQSRELYYDLCAYLMEKDELTYLDIIKFKYSLLIDDFNQELIDYFVMEYVLNKMRTKFPRALTLLTYLVTSKS